VRQTKIKPRFFFYLSFASETSGARSKRFPYTKGTFCVRGLLLLVVPDADIMSRRSEGNPGDVHPSRASQELVGVFMVAEEVDQALELLRVLGTNVSSLAQQVLRVTDTDGTHLRAGWLKQMLTTVDHSGKLVDGGDVVRIFVQTEELVQLKMG